MARAPDDGIRRFFHASYLLTAGHFDEARAHIAPDAMDGALRTVAELQRVASGSDAEAVRALTHGAAIRGYAERDDQGAWQVAQGLALAGAHDDAMQWLRLAAERGFVNARFVREIDETLPPLRAHADMPALLAFMEGRAAEIAT